MDNGVPPVADQTEDEVVAPVKRQVERRAAPRSRSASSNGNPPATGERRKSPPRPRKPAGTVATETEGDVAVADHIDPLLAASSAALDQAAAAKAEAGAEAKPVRRRPPARKPAPVVSDVVTDVVAPDPPTAELKVIDDFFAEPAVAEPPVVESLVAEPPVVERYVLPKIIPGEPEPEPEREREVESISAKVASLLKYRPQFRGVTKQLRRSLEPVVLPRHRPRVRRVTRVVRHIDTWSVFKIAVLFNIFLYAVCLTAGAMLWRVALNTGTIENIERFFESFGWQTFELKGGEIYHNAWIVGLFGVVGLTGLAVLAATMFNLITDLVGGVRITVLEEEVVAREQRVVTWPRLIRPATPPGGQPYRRPRPQPPAEPPID
ncbi:MAG: DUF3566 domain-containing protein [Actinomycetia bacterium]|nr:DUF3566 domain-containing protein [Actinomycetes bacterium]